MNTKKIFMIIILIAFLGIIGFALASTNNSSIKKISQTSENSETSNSQVSKNTGIVRKSTGKANADTNNMIKITDNFFIEQTNDLYLNLNDYIGKTIKIEGLVYSYEGSNGDICYAVIRNTPGCCGSDGLAGLDIRYDEDYPAENTWVEVIGVVGTDEMFGNKIPAIQVASMTIKEKGTTFVTN